MTFICIKGKRSLRKKTHGEKILRKTPPVSEGYESHSNRRTVKRAFILSGAELSNRLILFKPIILKNIERLKIG